MTVYRISQIKNKALFSFQSLQASRFFSQLQPKCSFGIAFDIDGVVLRGRFPIGGSSRALTRLYDDSGSLKVPFLFLTNGFDTEFKAMEGKAVKKTKPNCLPPKRGQIKVKIFEEIVETVATITRPSGTEPPGTAAVKPWPL